MKRPEPPSRPDFRYWHRLTLRWSDNDVYGHVNNAIYYQWFDSAVNSLLVERGLLDIDHGDPIALVVGTACDYFAPLAYPGEVDIGLAVVEFGRSSVRYRLGVFAPGTDKASAAGRFTHVAVGRFDRRPVPWPEQWRDVFGSVAAPERAEATA